MKSIGLRDLKEVSPRYFRDLRDKLVDSTENKLIICQLKKGARAVFIGSSTDESKLVQKEYCKKGKIPVLRTKMPHGVSGYHDSSEFRACATVKRSIIQQQVPGFRLMAKVAITALENAGIKTRIQGNNLFADEKKIGGVSAYAFKSNIIMCVRILLDWDIDTAEKAIVSPKHNMREHMSGLKALGYDITFDTMKAAFLKAWNEVFPELKVEIEYV
jgi:lipoate-protein ligase A